MGVGGWRKREKVEAGGGDGMTKGKEGKVATGDGGRVAGEGREELRESGEGVSTRVGERQGKVRDRGMRFDGGW